MGGVTQAGPLRDDSAGPLRDSSTGRLRDDSAGPLRDDSAGPLRDDSAGPLRDSSTGRPPGWSAPGERLVRSAATEPVPTLAELGRVHIIGIAGAGMSGLAALLLARGVPVSGCEARDSDTLRGLGALGARISVGHSAGHLDDVDSVVYSTAIPAGHLEMVAARARQLPTFRRAAALSAAIADKRGIAVAGTHGKTTTTSLLTVAAQACGLDPSFAIGGNLYESGRNAYLGSGEYVVVEADESDGSFLLLRPEIAIVTNVEADHLENHGDLEGIFWAFEQFVDRISDGGLLVACADHAGARRVADYARERGVRVRLYGTSNDADVRIEEIIEHPGSVEFTVTGTFGPRSVLLGALIGTHMARNGAAALTVAAELQLDLDAVTEAWAHFHGVRRRFEYRGEAAGVRVYDDYAHHPTEIAATLRAARSAVGVGRLVAVFQPGTYSRTQTFAREFAEAMALADLAAVMDVYPAREEPIPGVSGALIADQIPLPAAAVVYEPRWAATAARIADVVRAGDLVVTMGIGDVHLICAELLAELAVREGEGRP
jgi:UDP-N-acetylmuramate--alanine ligase